MPELLDEGAEAEPRDGDEAALQHEKGEPPEGWVTAPRHHGGRGP